MRKLFIAIFTITLLLIVLMCRQEEATLPVKPEINYLSTIQGGCNGKDSTELTGDETGKGNALLFLLKHDTLDVYIGLNYSCCTPFTTKTVVLQDSVFVDLNDNCPTTDQSCYCDCNCYYIWDVLFTDFKPQLYHFKITINDPRKDQPVVFQEGDLDMTQQYNTSSAMQSRVGYKFRSFTR